MHTLHFERCFTPCSHGPFVGGALFRFVAFVVDSSLDVSVFSASPAFGTGILTLGLQTVVIPIREVGAPTVCRGKINRALEKISPDRPQRGDRIRATAGPLQVARQGSVDGEAHVARVRSVSPSAFTPP